MVIPIIKYPGDKIELDQKLVAREVQLLLDCMDDSIIEAYLCLKWFNESVESSTIQLRKAYNENFKSSKQIRNINSLSISNIEEELVKIRVASEILPVKYLNKIGLIHANSFLLYVSKFSSCLHVLYHDYDLNDKVKSTYEIFNSSVPSIYQIRNSAQHVYDRIRGFGKDKKNKLNTGLYSNNIKGNKLGYTIADGSIKNIEISASTLKVLEISLQNIINSFKWSGLPKFSPLS